MFVNKICEITSEILFVIPRTLFGFAALSVDITTTFDSLKFLITLRVPKYYFLLPHKYFPLIYLNAYEPLHGKQCLFYIFF